MTTEEETMPTQTQTLTVPDVAYRGPSFPAERVEVRALDTELVADAPEDERVEVICLVDSFSQRLNVRRQRRKLEEEGIEIPDRFAERCRGDRFLLDAEDFARLHAAGAVVAPAELEVDKDLDERVAELEAERQEVERKRQEAREKARKRAEEIARRAVYGDRAEEPKDGEEREPTAEPGAAEAP
jgi:hypothetical protein